MITRVFAGLLIGLAAAGWLAVAGTPCEASEHAAASESGQETPDINPLDWKADLAIWTAVVFLVLLAVLWKFAWRPIANGLEKRERRIADEIASAERSNVEARQLLEEYHQKLAASGEEVKQMLEAARRDAEQTGQAIVEKAKGDAEAEHQRMLGEIELATSNALKELAEQSATLAVDLAGKIVAAKLDPKAHSHLIERAVADFSKNQPGNN